ncbi:MAG: TetR/AcrR family transcriptional regulator [Bacilli bacterium]
MDQRIKKTKRILKDTLTAMMQEQHFQNITVKDLTKRANINRGTFYLHYQDVPQMLSALEDEILFDLTKIVEKKGPIGPELSVIPTLIELIDYLHKDLGFCKMLVGPHGDINFVEKLKQSMIVEAKKTVPDLVRKYDDTFIHFLMTFIVSGSIGVFQEWFKSDCQTPLPYIMEPCEKMIVNGLSSM